MKNAVPARRSRFSCVDASLNTLTEMCRNVAGFVSLVLITSHAGVVNADNNDGSVKSPCKNLPSTFYDII